MSTGMTRPRESSSSGVALVVCHGESKDLKRHRKCTFDLKATESMTVNKLALKQQTHDQWQTLSESGMVNE